MNRKFVLASSAALAFSIGCQPPPGPDDLDPPATDSAIREDDGLGIDVTPNEGDVGSAYREAPPANQIRDPDLGPAAMVPDTPPVGADDYQGPNALGNKLSGATAPEPGSDSGDRANREGVAYPAAGGAEAADAQGRGGSGP